MKTTQLDFKQKTVIFMDEEMYTTLGATEVMGLSKAHAHRFRHSFGSNLIRAGVNIKVVQTLMRHETVNLTLDTYAHILDTDTEKAISEVYS